MSYANIAAELRDVVNPIKSIANYLNEKFTASVKRPSAGMSDITVDFEEFVQEPLNGLEKVKVQLAEKEKKLKGSKQELNKRNDEIEKQQNRIFGLKRELRHAKIRLAKGGIGKSAEDMSSTAVTARNVNNTTEPKCLNEKFPASVKRPLAGMNDIPVSFEELVHKLVDVDEKKGAQLAKKEKELSNTI